MIVLPKTTNRKGGEMKALVSYLPEVREKMKDFEETFIVPVYKSPVDVLNNVLFLGEKAGALELSLGELCFAFLIAQSGCERFCEPVGFWTLLSSRLTFDSEGYGDTWRHREIKGQTSRTMSRIRDYRDKLKYGEPSVSEMLLKTCGNLFICIVRLLHPAYQMEDVLTK